VFLKNNIRKGQMCKKSYVNSFFLELMEVLGICKKAAAECCGFFYKGLD